MLPDFKNISLSEFDSFAFFMTVICAGGESGVMELGSSHGVIPPPTNSFILQEDGLFILQENGSFVLQE
jgi:hypothetical protein